MQIVKTFKNKIRIQTFENSHNVSCRYVSYVKPKTFDIWRKIGWYLKPFAERVEENHIYDLVKPNSTVTSRTVYRECNVCDQVIWKMENCL